MGFAILPSGGPEEIRITMGRASTSRPAGYRPYNCIQKGLDTPIVFIHVDDLKLCPAPRDINWTLDLRQQNHCVQVQWLFALAPMSVTQTLPLR